MTHVMRRSRQHGAIVLSAKKRGAMTIRTILLSLVGVLGLAVLVFAGINAYQAVAVYRASAAFLAADHVADLLLSGANQLDVESGLAKAGLTSAVPLSDEQRAKFRDAGAAADHSLDEALSGLGIVPAMADSAKAIAEAKKAVDDLRALRERVYADVGKPYGERDGSLVDAWDPAISDAIDRITN